MKDRRRKENQLDKEIKKKSWGVKNNQSNKKRGKIEKEKKKRMGLMEKTEQTAVLHIKLAPISRCALRRSLSLSLWSGKMYFSAFYTHVFMKW